MANISTDDVRTYIVDLIEKELGSCDKRTDAATKKSRKTDMKRSKTGRHFPKKRKQKV